MKKITTPLDPGTTGALKAGDWVEISGIIYGARDAAHKRFYELAGKGKTLPVDLRGQVIYYVGPTPAPPGKIIGSCGPTTSSRMDRYTPLLLECGLKGMIGKGRRCEAVRQMIRKYNAVYFVTFGGCGAYLSRFFKKVEIAAFPDLGPEAVFRFEVEDFPALVEIDSLGNDFYKNAGSSIINQK
jgi:fumarate hydratase subunit beta